MKIHTIWVSDTGAWGEAWLFHAEDEYTSEENAELWNEMMEKAHAAYGFVRACTLIVPERQVAALFKRTEIEAEVEQ